jgi:TM2 domain-containing membrane protein YozV
MKCANHPRTEAPEKCAECGKPLCAECAVKLKGGAWCRECLLRIVVEKAGREKGKRHRSRLVAGLLSILPGVGHMYLGMIGKGFALFGLLIASIFLVILYSDSTGMYWMTAFLVPTLSVLLLSYAVFDSMAIAEAIRAGREPNEISDATMKTVWERILLNRRAGGYVLLVAGAIGVLHLFDEPLGALMRQYAAVDVRITALVIPVVLLVIGIWLLGKGRRAGK